MCSQLPGPLLTSGASPKTQKLPPNTSAKLPAPPTCPSQACWSSNLQNASPPAWGLWALSSPALPSFLLPYSLAQGLQREADQL